MRIKEWVDVIKRKEFIFIFFDVLLLTLPGIGVLFLYDRPAFMELDWVRLILLGAAIMAPLDFLNMMLLSDFFAEFGGKDRDTVFVSLTASIASTCLMVYISVAVFYLAGKSAHYTAIATLTMEAILIIAVFINARWRIYKEAVAAAKKSAKDRKESTSG